MLHGGFSLGLVCNSAIPPASERAKTTTIALCKASTDPLKSWKMTPNTDTSQRVASLQHTTALELWSQDHKRLPRNRSITQIEATWSVKDPADRQVQCYHELWRLGHSCRTRLANASPRPHDRKVMNTLLMVRIPSVFSPRHHTQKDRQSQCHQRTLVTGSSCRTRLANAS